MHLVPLAELPVAFQRAELLFEHIFQYFGLTEDIVRDQRPQFQHSATKLTPFQCILGYQPPLYPWNANSTESPAVDEWFRWSEWEQTHQHLEAATHRTKENAHRCQGVTPDYKEGDRVWLATQDL